MPVWALVGYPWHLPSWEGALGHSSHALLARAPCHRPSATGCALGSVPRGPLICGQSRHCTKWGHQRAGQSRPTTVTKIEDEQSSRVSATGNKQNHTEWQGARDGETVWIPQWRHQHKCNSWPQHVCTQALAGPPTMPMNEAKHTDEQQTQCVGLHPVHNISKQKRCNGIQNI